MKMKQWIILALILGVVASGVLAIVNLSAKNSATVETTGNTASVDQPSDSAAEQTDQGPVQPEPSAQTGQETVTTIQTGQADTKVPAASAADRNNLTKGNAKIITPDQLKAANGVNGAPAYIAYHGKVYDVSGESVFQNGVHIYDPNIKAGMDLTNLFDKSAPDSHRANQYISRLKEVGVLGTGANSGSSAASPGSTGAVPGKNGSGANSVSTDATSSPTPPPPAAKPSSSTAKPAVGTPGTKTFTLAQLKAANGVNGAPAYIAYHGRVYDLAGDPAFVNGVHKYDKNIRAGMDLTNLFDNQAPSSHQANNYISRLTMVGVLDTASGQNNTATGTNSSPAPLTKPAVTPKPSVSPAGTRTFTEAQLKAANGINGAPAYIAYHGKVYDLAGDPAFVNGVHKYDKNIRAGMDLTNLFENQAPSSHRAKDYISRLTLVGLMDASYTGPAPSTGAPGSGSEHEDGEEWEDD